MDQDKESSNKKPSQGKRGNRKRKPRNKPKDESQQVSISNVSSSSYLSSRPSENEPVGVSGDIVDEFGALTISTDLGAAAAPVKPSVIPDPLLQLPEKEPKLCESDAAAFDAEEEEIKKKIHRGKKSAEDAYCELGEIFGINFNNEPALCLRDKFQSGKIGKRVLINTNFFRLRLTGAEVYQYDIGFLKPDNSSFKKEKEIGRKFKRITKKLNQSLLKEFVKTTGADLFENKSYAYDNERILITNDLLPGITKDGKIYSFSMSEPSADGKIIQPYLIRIKKTVDLNLAFETFIQEVQNSGINRALLQVMDIICKTHAFQNDIIYGSKIFFSAESPLAQSFGKRQAMEGFRGAKTPFELAFGYHQSAQLCQGGPMLNIDRATAVLYKAGPLIDAMCQILRFDSPAKIQVNHRNHHLLDELTYIRIKTNYRHYECRHTIKSFSKKSARQLELKIDDCKTTVAEYFCKQYGITLKYPDLPCIVYSKNIFIPVELCEILPNQRNQRKLRDELIREVSRISKQTPNERLAHTLDIAGYVSKELKKNQFNIALDTSHVTVEGRILPPPKLRYSNVSNFEPPQGSWDMRGKRFVNPIELKNWTIFILESRRLDSQIAKRFVELLKQTGNTLGMTISDPDTNYETVLFNNIEKKFNELKLNGLQLIVVMMPETVDYYRMVKYLGDQRLGIPTQVVLDKHYDKRAFAKRQKLFDVAYLSNLLLKINTKIGGVNLYLGNPVKCSILTKKTMVVGIDVNHPSPGEKTRSIAAVVGSFDEQFMKYRTEIQANRERDELVRVDEMIIPILEKFKSERESYPENIIVYRDGVSEGQFAHVMGHEILPLYKKLQEISTRIQLTYIIVQKRHNARFYPKEGKDVTKSGNILPGTVIDTDVVHFKWFDFYLCSQNSLLGTARPGKYTVLWNSSNAQADDLQVATYYLCYLFARATKSIADPAPARYAHHAAERGKILFREIARVNKWTDKQINAEINKAISVDNNYANTLYFS